MLLPDDPLMFEAADALRRYHDAQAAGSWVQEVGRCCLLAESLFQAVGDFNQRVLGRPSDTRH